MRQEPLWSQNPSPASNSSNLPNELWFQIVQHILNDQLYQMIGLNKFFLEVGMDVKWRSVKLDTESMGEAMHLLKRLQWVTFTGAIHICLIPPFLPP
jgi:hypothetical protein